MSFAADEDYMQNLIFEGGAPAAGYDPDETQSQDGHGAFTPVAGYDPDQVAFMRDQVGIDLDGDQLQEGGQARCSHQRLDRKRGRHD